MAAIRKYVSSFIGNGDGLGVTGDLTSWCSTTTSFPTAAHFCLDHITHYLILN